ncbi:MAG: ABC transporter ATP-binding protein [Candidatus Berkelbacteria bacterium]
MSLIEIQNLTKTFDLPGRKVEVLRDIDLEIKEGEYLLIFGPSGCGKTTLLNLILGLETPTSGKLKIKDQNIAKFTPQERTAFRYKNFSTVYQNSIWLKSLNVLENVALPLYLGGLSEKESKEKAREALKLARTEEFALSRPNELSSGEQQRVSLARAMVTDAQIIIADEPTGNLDSKAGHELMKTLDHLHNLGKTIILVTHNLSYLVHADTKIAMKDGQIIGRFTENALPHKIKEMLEEE